MASDEGTIVPVFSHTYPEQRLRVVQWPTKTFDADDDTQVDLLFTGSTTGPFPDRFLIEQISVQLDDIATLAIAPLLINNPGISISLRDAQGGIVIANVIPLFITHSDDGEGNFLGSIPLPFGRLILQTEKYLDIFCRIPHLDINATATLNFNATALIRDLER